MNSRRERGEAAERRARRHLEDNGLRCVETNYRCRWGEIDLVMRERDTLVFVEVRYRNSDRFGGATASVDSTKRRRLCRAASDYLARLRGPAPAARFDVVALGPGDRIEWINGAFDGDG